MERKERHVNVGDLSEKLQALKLAEDTVAESLQILADEYMIDDSVPHGGRIHHTTIAVQAFENYCLATIDGYADLKRTIGAQLANEGMTTNHALVERYGQPRIIVDQVLDALESDGFISVTYMTSSTVQVTSVKPQLGRALSTDEL